MMREGRLLGCEHVGGRKPLATQEIHMELSCERALSGYPSASRRTLSHRGACALKPACNKQSRVLGRKCNLFPRISWHQTWSWEGILTKDKCTDQSKPCDSPPFFPSCLPPPPWYPSKVLLPPRPLR